MRTLLWLVSLLLSCTLHAQITILIDPGHGGSDPGHESLNPAHLPEKDLNLIIAKKFGNYLSTKLSNIKVLYTRTDDSFPTLDERVNLANTLKVDYFISIHCNGSPNRRIAGTESHVHTMSAGKSVKLARTFEQEFSVKAGRKSRGVKDSDDREHTLQVLKFTEMTSVLVECGFLTNENEASYLNTSHGQDIIASALFRGMRTFLVREHPSICITPSNTSVTGPAGGYTIQIMSSKDALETTLPAFKKLDKPVVREQIAQSGYKYRYVVGTFENQAAANAYLTEVRRKGFPDAIVVRPRSSTVR